MYPKNEQQKAIAPLIKNNRNNLKNVELKNLVKLFTFPLPRCQFGKLNYFGLST